MAALTIYVCHISVHTARNILPEQSNSYFKKYIKLYIQFCTFHCCRRNIISVKTCTKSVGFDMQDTTMCECYWQLREKSNYLELVAFIIQAFMISLHTYMSEVSPNQCVPSHISLWLHTAGWCALPTALSFWWRVCGSLEYIIDI